MDALITDDREESTSAQVHDSKKEKEDRRLSLHGLTAIKAHRNACSDALKAHAHLSDFILFRQCRFNRIIGDINAFVKRIILNSSPHSVCHFA